MEGFDEMVRLATDIIGQHDRAKETIAESSNYSEVEQARDFLAGFQEIASDMQNQFVGMMARLEQIEAKAEELGPKLDDDFKARIRQARALMQKFSEMSRE